MNLLHTIKTGNAPVYHSSSYQHFFLHFYIFNIKQVVSICYNSQGQAIVQRSHHTLTTMSLKLKGGDGNLRMILNKALFTLNFQNKNSANLSLADIHFSLGTKVSPTEGHPFGITFIC